MSNVICIAISSKQESAEGGSSRVVARGDVKFEKMEGGEGSKKAWSAPQGVKRGLQENDGQGEGYAKGDAEKECAKGNGGWASLGFSEGGSWRSSDFGDVTVVTWSPRMLFRRVTLQ